MDKQSQFHNAIENNDWKKFNSLLNDPEVVVDFDNNYPFRLAVYNCSEDIVISLLKDSRINPSEKGNNENQGIINSYPIVIACYSYNVDLLENLLCFPNVDPSVEDNLPLKLCFQANLSTILYLLWNDKRVKNSYIKNHDKKSQLYQFLKPLIETEKIKSNIDNFY